jgi:lipoyl-dependent peroxiredoxin
MGVCVCFTGLGRRSRTFIVQRFMSVFVFETAFMKQYASAVWVGSLKGGKGNVTTESGALSRKQYFANDNVQGRCTNPNELIAAAHAACFSMALANKLASEGFAPDCINTTATVTMEKLSGGWTITGIQLDVLVQAPRVKQSDFIRAAVSAKTNCTISRALKTNISMSAKLENSVKSPRSRGSRAPRIA